MRYVQDGMRTWVDRGMGYVPDQGLGSCFTGSCAEALAPYGWETPPCGVPAPLAGPQDGLGNCFTGSCGQALTPYGWDSSPCGVPQGPQVQQQAIVAVFVPRRPVGFLK